MAPRILLSPLGLYSLLGLATAPWRLGLNPLGLRRLSDSATSPVGLYGALALLLPLGLYHLSGSATAYQAVYYLIYYPLDSAIAPQAPFPLGLCYQAMLSPLGLYHLSGLAIASRSPSPLRLCYRLSGSAASRALPPPFRALSSRALPSH